MEIEIKDHRSFRSDEGHLSEIKPPMPSENQRRCWTITSAEDNSFAQCWLYNGHEGEHYFGEPGPLRKF